MADGGPPALQPPPVVPPVQSVVLPCTSCTNVVLLAQPGSQLNWLHFKPEFADRPGEDAEAHLLRTNDWMGTYAFQEGVKIQRFCLTLVGEARLWHGSLRHIAVARMVCKLNLDSNIQE